MNERIACCIPFCTHGTRRFGYSCEILCAAHYRLVPRSLKSLRRRLRRRWATEHRDAQKGLRAALCNSAEWCFYRKKLIDIAKRIRRGDGSVWNRMKAAVMP